MGFSGAGRIWLNGSLVDWPDAKIHIASHVIHYGSGVFEGVRCYSTPKGSVCFRLGPHIKRLFNSARIYRMEYRLGIEAFQEAVLDTIRANPFTSCYIRPIIYRGYEALGVNPLTCPVDRRCAGGRRGRTGLHSGNKPCRPALIPCASGVCGESLRDWCWP